MIGTLHALAVDPDPAMLRFLAEALSTFQPGFQVSTAKDLETASRWMDVKLPDLVVVRIDAFEPDELATWFTSGQIDQSRVLAISVEPAASVDVGAHLAEPVSLTLLLDTARALTRPGEARHRPPTPSTQNNRVRQLLP